MKKMIVCLLLVALVLPTVALADSYFDFEIADSMFNKYVYSSTVRNEDNAPYGGFTPTYTDLQGDDTVVFTIVNTNNDAISDSVTFNNTQLNIIRHMYYTTSTANYYQADVKLRGKFSPRNYTAKVGGIWAP